MNKSDYDLINLGACIKLQADRLRIEHEGVPLEGVVVRIANAALSRAAAREPLHESPAIQAARDVLDGLEPWEIHDRAREEIRSVLDDIPCCESATAMVHAEDHGAPESDLDALRAARAETWDEAIAAVHAWWAAPENQRPAMIVNPYGVGPLLAGGETE